VTSPLNAFLISRRRVLQGGAALSAATLAGRNAFAAPAKPLTFIGWQYHPEIVDQNVDTFKKLYEESVTYELVSGDYHPVVETKLTGGQHVDMMYSEEDHIARWNAADWTRDFEGLPDIDAIKTAMFPVAVASLSLPSGKIAGLPYYAGHNAFIYNEEHLSKSGLQVPDSWDTLLDACRKLKKDGISDAPYNSAWGQKWPELSWSLFSCWYAEGAPVFDDKSDFVDDASLRKVLEVHRTLYNEQLVAADIMTMPDEGVPSYATGRHTFMILHDYDQKVANDPKMSKAAGKVKNALMPGKAHSTFAWTAAYLMAKQPIDVDRAWSLVRFFGGKARRAIPCHQALGARIRSWLRLQGSHGRSRSDRQLLEMARGRHFQQAASASNLPQDREDNLVPGMGSVHDATCAGLHPRQRLDRPTSRAVERQGRRTQEAVPVTAMESRLTVGEACLLLERSLKLTA
jgi:multiple sugar transport system substrate-binding protein